MHGRGRVLTEPQIVVASCASRRLVRGLAILILILIGGPGGDAVGVANSVVDASGLSDEARRLVVEYNERPYNGITRWTAYPIRVWADANHPSENLRDAVELWNQALGVTGARFEVAANEESANIRFRVGPRPSGYPGCGNEGPTRIQDNVISEGQGTHYFNEDRCNPASWDGATRVPLAHGIGHVLGLAGHTASGSDVMGTPEASWGISNDLREAMRFIYNSPPGARVTTSPSPTPTTSPSPSTWNRTEQTDSALMYSSNWQLSSSPAASSESYQRSRRKGANARFTFEGTGIRWIGAKSPNGGIARVLVDGVRVGKVDQYASTTSWQQTVLEKVGLSPGSHTIEVWVTGRLNPSARSGRSYIDAFEVLP